jgi:hypothetical protein
VLIRLPIRIATGDSSTWGTSEAFEPVYADLPASFHGMDKLVAMGGKFLMALPTGRACISFVDRNQAMRGFLKVPLVTPPVLDDNKYEALRVRSLTRVLRPCAPLMPSGSQRNVNKRRLPNQRVFASQSVGLGNLRLNMENSGAELMIGAAPPLTTRLLGLFQMRHRSFGVSRSFVGIALFALIDCLFQMFDRFFGVRISLGFLPGLRVGERGLGVSGKDIGMALLAMVNGLLGMCDGFGDMIFSSQRTLRH